MFSFSAKVVFSCYSGLIKVLFGIIVNDNIAFSKRICKFDLDNDVILCLD